jgi:hypothetical protein
VALRSSEIAVVRKTEAAETIYTQRLQRRLNAENAERAENPL